MMSLHILCVHVVECNRLHIELHGIVLPTEAQLGKYVPLLSYYRTSPNCISTGLNVITLYLAALYLGPLWRILLQYLLRELILAKTGTTKLLSSIQSG
jgi:hypothetical protein